MTKPVVYKINSGLALDDSKRLFLAIAGYVMPKLKPEDRGPLTEIFNRFQPAARDAAPQPSTQKKEPSMKSGTGVGAVMNYLKENLSEEQIAELADIMSQCASGGVDGSQSDPLAMAMMQALDLARTETAEVLGPQANDMALDAATLYGRALRVMGVDFAGVKGAKALRLIYRTAVNGRKKTGQPLIALDAKRVASLHERFPGAARIRGV